MTKISSPQLEWMQEYLELVTPIIPNVKKLKRIYLIKVSTKKKQKIEGVIWEERKRYEIGLYTKYQDFIFNPIRVTIKPYSKIDLLSALAHELAHLYHWYHTVEHTKLELRLYGKFLTRLKKNGYISEEHELKIYRRDYGKV